MRYSWSLAIAEDGKVKVLCVGTTSYLPTITCVLELLIAIAHPIRRGTNLKPLPTLNKMRLHFVFWLNMLTVVLVGAQSIAMCLRCDTYQTPLYDDPVKEVCDCAGIVPDAKYPNKSVQAICGDMRLGPRRLPALLPLISIVSNYDRFGVLTPAAFLQTYWNSDKHSWKYPDGHGFSLDANKNEVAGKMALKFGTLVDRFGSETGQYVSAADAPYNQRSLHPQYLFSSENIFSYSYTVYTVAKSDGLEVLGGPVAPWFGQPGLGAQFYLGNTTVPKQNDPTTGTTISDLLTAGECRPRSLSWILCNVSLFGQ